MSATETLKETILITAANSHTGFTAAQELLALGFPVRAFVRNRDKPKAKELESLGAELFVGNMNDIRDVRMSMDGIRRAYFCQPYAPYSLYTGMTFAVAAEEMKLEHVASLTQWFASNTHPSLTTREHWLTDRIVRMSPTVKYTLINPSWAFPFVYFLSLELIAQMGIMPDMGKNALPSDEDMGAVAAHILKDPARHAGKTYRPTGPRILSTQEMADIIGTILGRRVAVRKMSKQMFRKAVKAAGLPLYTYTQVADYNDEAFNGTMEVSAPTSVVKDIVGREPEDFETIARRYIADSSVVDPSVLNKLRAFKNLVKIILTRVPDMKTYHRAQGHPVLKDPQFCYQNKEWRAERGAAAPVTPPRLTQRITLGERTETSELSPVL